MKSYEIVCNVLVFSPLVSLFEDISMCLWSRANYYFLSFPPKNVLLASNISQFKRLPCATVNNLAYNAALYLSVYDQLCV